MILKCLIIDDEPPAQRVIEKFVNEFPSLKLVGKCFNAREALDSLHKNNIDLIFLDINMPIITGLEFLRTLQNPPLVIITTAYREYAIEGYELNVVDYLTKPIVFARFFQAIDKALDKVKTKETLIPNISENQFNKTNQEFIFVKEDKVTYKVELKDIFYIESVGDYVKIITAKKSYITYQTMKYMESLLSNEKFPRVHKSFLINLSQISKIEGNLITINEKIIPIGKTFRTVFFKLLDKLQ